MKHFSPRLKELAVKAFVGGDSVVITAHFYDTSVDRVEGAIRQRLKQLDEQIEVEVQSRLARRTPQKTTVELVDGGGFFEITPDGKKRLPD